MSSCFVRVLPYFLGPLHKQQQGHMRVFLTCSPFKYCSENIYLECKSGSRPSSCSTRASRRPGACTCQSSKMLWSHSINKEEEVNVKKVADLSVALHKKGVKNTTTF